MTLVRSYLAAFRKAHTYDPFRNAYVGFGFAWGLPIPVFALAFDLALGAPCRGLGAVLSEHPVQLVFLAHPLLFAAVFGAMGTLRHELERENARLIASLQELASTDVLTGIANRRKVLEELDGALARSSRSGAPFTLVLFDLDGFKRINDEQGHPAGDLILKKAAAALRGVVRQGDTLGRYGGDEFVLVSHGDEGEAATLVARAEEAVRRETGLGLSAGLAAYPRDGGTAAGLVAVADARLYGVKGTRRRERPLPAG